MKRIRKTSDYNQTLLKAIENSEVKLIDAFLKSILVKQGVAGLQVHDGTGNVAYWEHEDTIAKCACYIIEVWAGEAVVEKAIRYFSNVQSVTEYNKTTPYKLLRRNGDEMTRGFMVYTHDRGFVYARTIAETFKLY